jgi:hypothetical protein
MKIHVSSFNLDSATPFVITKIDQIFKIPHRLEVINDLSFSKIITKKGHFVAQRSNLFQMSTNLFCRTEFYMTKITPK